MRKILICLAVSCSILMVLQTAQAQEIYFKYHYNLDMLGATEPPDLNASPDVQYPENARKNGVEGTVKAEAILGENGQVRDVVIKQDLPFGVGDAVAAGLRKLYFRPAKKNGKPTPVKLYLDYIVTVSYGENDKNVNKPKITDKPPAVYPENQRSSAQKGKVSVSISFHTDGTIEILGVSSTMPKEFDRAAEAAAKKIKFQPATHKKSKSPVTAAMSVEYDFKP